MKENLNHCLGRTTLRQLRALSAVLRSGSTKAAAEALHVTPPAITLQLRELEAAAGAPLIERRPNGATPTAVGAELLDAAERIEAILADAADAILFLKGLKGGKVTVGVISTAKYFAPKAREAGSGTRAVLEELFADAGSALRIGMEIGSNETIKQAVIAGLGIALISAHTIAAEVADGRLAVLDVENLPVVRRWFIVARADKRLSPAAGAMWTFLATHARTFLPAASP
jgi:DNA-binding transcriptional LysR family regulator